MKTEQELDSQEKACLVEILAFKPTETHIKNASNFSGTCTYTTNAIRALAEVCRTEYECVEIAEILEKAALQVAVIEAQVI
jgi:hypothetical protein